MKRSSPLMLLPALFLAAFLWPGSALAASGLPYDADTVVSVLALTQEQEELVSFLYAPVLRHETKIVLPERTRYDDLSAAMNSLMQDYPEMFHLHKEFSIGYERSAPEIALYVTLEYRMGVKEAQLLREELYAVARDLAARYATAEALHDVLVARVSYGGSDDMRHTAAGALLNGVATCEGYAQALTLLYRMAGIPCGMITGVATNSEGRTDGHAWSIADMGGYTLIDATWNDQERLGLNTHWYFGLSTAQMYADHRPDSNQHIPACGNHANWHVQRGTAIRTREEAFAAIRTLVHFGGTVNLRVENERLYHALAIGTGDFLDAYNAASEPEDCFYGSYSVVRSDAQMCVIITKTD